MGQEVNCDGPGIDRYSNVRSISAASFLSLLWGFAEAPNRGHRYTAKAITNVTILFTVYIIKYNILTPQRKTFLYCSFRRTFK